MDIKLLGQGYNSDINTSVACELVELLNDSTFTKFTCLVAFASYSGISGLTDKIHEAQHRGLEVNVIIGIDQLGTSKEALDELIEWNANAYVFHSKSSPIYHPKIYLFENNDEFAVIIGSNNLTEFGLLQNVECSVLLRDSKSNILYTELYSYWGSLINRTDPTLLKVTKENIQQLSEAKLIPSESVRISKHESSKRREATESKTPAIFKKLPYSRRPIGFVPKRILLKKQVASAQTSTSVEIITSLNEILIAEIPKSGNRWKQVNFSKDLYNNFWGYAYNTSKTIFVASLELDGTLGELKTKSLVSVSSDNHRVEITCGESQYPAGGKPIGIYVKTSLDHFVSLVIFPQDAIYSTVLDYLTEKYNGPTNRVKRITTTFEQLFDVCPELPFFNH